jgi:chitinase
MGGGSGAGRAGMSLFSHVVGRGRARLRGLAGGLLALAGVGLLGAAVPLLTASASTPTLTLSASQGSPGASLRALGSGFGGGQAAQVSWQPANAAATNVWINSSGGFNTWLRAPKTPGTYVVYVSAARGQSAETTFTVTGPGGTIAQPSPTATRTPTRTPTTAPATATPTRTPATAPATATPTQTPSPAATATPATPGASPSGRRVVAYFPIWIRNSGYTEKDVDFSAVNVVAHFSVVPNKNGTIQVPNWGPFPDTALIAAAHANGAKIVLVVGGDHAESTQNFSAMAGSSTARAAFVSNIVAMVDQYGYDGIDIDWEFPQTTSDRTSFTALVGDLRAGLPPGKTLSIAAPATDWFGRWIDVPAVIPHLDWLGAMTYTCGAASWSPTADHNSPLYGPCGGDAARQYYLGRGVPREKLLLGVPFYGERYDGAEDIGDSLSNKSGGAMAYPQVAALLSNGWTRYTDTSAGVPYLRYNSGMGVVVYDDPWSIGLKCQYVKDRELGGVIVWSLGQDRIGYDQPLLQAAKACR